MKTVLLLGGPAAGQRAEIHGTMAAWISGDAIYKIVPMCSHGEVHWFGVLPGADPLALLIAGYMAPIPFFKASMPNGDAELLESIHLRVEP